MQLSLFSFLFMCIALSFAIACTVDNTGNANIERFNLTGKCKKRNLISGLACGCYVLYATEQLTPQLAQLCKDLFRADPRNLVNFCPPRFIYPGHEVSQSLPNEENISCLRVESLFDYIRQSADCFQANPGTTFPPSARDIINPEESSSGSDKVPSISKSIQNAGINRETKVVLENISREIGEKAKDAINDLEKCVKCLRCINLRLCENTARRGWLYFTYRRNKSFRQGIWSLLW